MPSPIAHSATAFVLWPALGPKVYEASPERRWALAGLLVFWTCAPDADFLPHILLNGDGMLGHGGPTHSFASGLVAAGVFAVIGRVLVPVSFVRLAVVGCLAWWLHVIMDVATRGGGVMALWPLSDLKYSLPIPVFYGAHHSEPLAWRLHLITLSTEVPFFAALWWIGRQFGRGQREKPHAPAGELSRAT